MNALWRITDYGRIMNRFQIIYSPKFISQLEQIVSKNLRYLTIYSDDLPDWPKYLGYLKKKDFHLVSVVRVQDEITISCFAEIRGFPQNTLD